MNTTIIVNDGKYEVLNLVISGIPSILRVLIACVYASEF